MILTIKEILEQTVLEFEKAGIDNAALDARILVQHATGLSREDLFLNSHTPFPTEHTDRLNELIAQRCLRKPVSKIIENREFWSLPFVVTVDTLDPRPDSETLIEAVLAKVNRTAPLKILDLGTGTGCLLLALLSELPLAIGTAVDISASALQVAQENARRLKLAERCTFVQCSWFEHLEGKYDIILSNPPYIPSDDLTGLAPEVTLFDPEGALDGGHDGLDAYRHLITNAPVYLIENGILALELGIHQEYEVTQLLRANDFRNLETHFDLSGIARVLTAVK